MWPKATNVLEEFYYHWRRKRRGVGVGGVGGWGSRRARTPHFFIGGGAMICLCPHF